LFGEAFRKLKRRASPGLYGVTHDKPCEVSSHLSGSLVGNFLPITELDG
jgi:hypothetical protein